MRPAFIANKKRVTLGEISRIFSTRAECEQDRDSNFATGLPKYLLK
jgi:hypothetical protein